MTVEVQIIGRAVMPAPGDPGLDGAGSEPDVIIVLPRVVGCRGCEGRRIAFREAQKIRSADFVGKPRKGPQAIPAGLVAEKRIHEVTGPLLDTVGLAVSADERARNRN